MASLSEHGGAWPQERVAGGYQLLQTLVAIRLRSVKDPQSVRHLTWLSDIVAALGLLNRRTTGSAPIDFNGYLDDTAAFWRRACEGRGIRLEVRGIVEALPDSHALPLAIILHELMSNALRHAFPADVRGSIAIAFSQSSDGISLVVRDSGVGSPDLVWGEGLSLIQGLVENLAGSISTETAAGAGFGVRIRLPLDAARHH